MNFTDTTYIKVNFLYPIQPGNDGEKSSSDVTFSCVTQLKEELSNIQSLLSSLHLTTEGMFKMCEIYWVCTWYTYNLSKDTSE